MSVKITETLNSTFEGKSIVIIGDLVADQFLHGTISRVSREAPVFILRHDDTHTLPGAAANAAANVAALGGTPVLIGVAGRDQSGEQLRKVLCELGVDDGNVLDAETIRTTTKIRVLAGQQYAARQQVIRIDYEGESDLPDSLKADLLSAFSAAADRADAIIVSDYGYGAVFPEIYTAARRLAENRKIPLVVDSRYRLTDLKNATSATPNREEVENILGKDFSEDDCIRLCREHGYAALLVTNGNKGMQVFVSGERPVSIAPFGPTEPVDVTGAGDTVIAAYALGLASGLSYVHAAELANHAGGIVVMKKRTATVSAAELVDSFRDAAEESG